MSEQPEHATAWDFDLADRMRRALRVSGVGVQDMADYLGVTRGTVGSWINGRIEPSVQSVRLWALRTGAPYVWLKDGVKQETPSPSGDGVNVRPTGFEPTTF